MAFWGIEVKPGKPITHSCEKAGGRLRISQATLGIGEATSKTIVQCNVGNRSPVLLCVLLPDRTESCHLDLEFEEADDVVFSVIGPRSVYLTGYYIRQIYHSNPHSDTESYGVDIENTQTEGSSYGSDEDKYDDSFINDDELQVSAKSPILSSKGLDEVEPGNEKPKERKGRGKKLKKKHKVIESDSDANAHESEDVDHFALSFRKTIIAAKTTASDAGDKIAQVTVEMGDDAKTAMSDAREKIAQITVGKGDVAKDDGVYGGESKKKVDNLDIYGELEREAKLPLDEEGTKFMNEKDELSKEMKTREETTVSNEKVLPGDKIHENTPDTIINQNLPMGNVKDQTPSIDLSKPKKKRKERSKKKKKNNEIQINLDDSVPGEDKENIVEDSLNLDSHSGQKTKKRKKEVELGGTTTDGADKNGNNISNVDKSEEGLPPADGVAEDLTGANEESEEQQRLEKICIEALGALSQNKATKDKLVEGSIHADSTMEDLPVTNGELEEQHTDNNVYTKLELLSNDSQPEKKTKKKIKRKSKKTLTERGLDMDVTKTADNQETVPMKHESQNTDAVPIQQRTLSNGLIIEELASGPSDGKVAALGKTVKIFYTGMLKENSQVFESNVGKAAFKFQLGGEVFRNEWSVGIDGMRVGDKRRVIVPPSLGFGDQGVEDKIPPNSWLVYDVELVSVRR